MTRITKNLIIYSLIGALQFGIGAAAVEASPRNEARASQFRHEQRVHQQSYRGDHDRDRRVQEERERHEREMVRRERESEWAWHERQRAENERHEDQMKIILGAAILFTILNNN